MNETAEILIGIANENNGVLTTDSVIEAASDPSSPLHSHFEWDDSAAAREYRRWQARSLIASCRVVMADCEAVKIRTFVSLPSDRTQGGGYRMRVDVLQDKDQAEELRMEMFSRIRYWQEQAKLISPKLMPILNRFEKDIQGIDAQATA